VLNKRMIARSVAVATISLLLFGMACSEPPAGSRAMGSGTTLEVTAGDGFSVYRGRGFAFAYPTGWTASHDGGRFIDDPLVEFAGPDPAGGLPPLIDLFREEGFEGDIDTYVRNFNIGHGTTLPARSVVRDEPASVQGALGARIIETRFDAAPLLHRAGRPDSPMVVRQIDLLVVAPGGVTIDLRTTAPARDFMSLSHTFETVIDSLTVGNGG
jgi:hypothetical protein